MSENKQRRKPLALDRGLASLPHGMQDEPLEIHAMPGHLIRRMNQWSMALFASKMAQAEIDLTPVQFAALYVIGQKPGLDQATLASSIAYDRVTIGGVVDRLEQKSYLKREIAPGDRRARQLTLTLEGAAVLVEATPHVRGLQDHILNGLTPEERQIVQDLLWRALRNASEPEAG